MDQKQICQACTREFLIDAQDQSFYQKVNVPLPTFCWLCRAQRRMAWRNESSLFKRKSDFSGAGIFSAFSPDSPVKVYEKDIWLSDKWDPMEYGREYDFHKPFFEQFADLLRTVPLKNLNLVGGMNSDYCNNFTDPKNCYLCFNGKASEECMYGNGLSLAKECIDNSHLSKCERCYEGFWLTSCSRAFFSSRCESCFDIAFCRDLTGCSNCFGCVGLRNKSYCIFNEQYSKEEYFKKLEEFDLSSYEKLAATRKKVAKFWLKFPNKFIEGTHNAGVSGNYVEHSKNSRNCFLVREGENIRYCQYMQEPPGSKDCYDYTAWGDSNELVYECTACGIGTNLIKFCYNVQENVRNIEYSYMCFGSSDLFGCVGVRKKQYCIFNKQYSKEEYETLRAKIIEQMGAMPYRDKSGRTYKYGEFFPIELSPFAYNESLAQEYFPLTKDEALAAGYTWRDAAERNYATTIRAQDLPDTVTQAQDSLVDEVIGCEHGGKCNELCTKAFRITSQELQFYRQMNLALPRLCQKCRHFQRLQQRSGLNVWPRQCQCGGDASQDSRYQNQGTHPHGSRLCPNEFETSYPPTSHELVYCEQCYQSEVI